MAQEKTVYAHGELSRVRGNLGELDKDEARRMVEVLGGEVGYEGDKEAAAKPKKDTPAGPGKKPLRRIETAEDEEADELLLSRRIRKKYDPSDDPDKPLKAGYWNRVRMDKYLALPEFGIKTAGQALISMLSFFGDPTDSVSPSFVTKRMNEYYKKIETLVTSVRTLLPRNNLRRNEQLKKVSPFAYTVIDAIRCWDIDRISLDLSRIQIRPRDARTQDFSEILRNIYRPLFILENLTVDTHIKGAFKLLYKVLYLEDPAEAKNKYQELIRTAIMALGLVRSDIRYQLYPLLMKLLSHCWLPYDLFFGERSNRICAFLQATEENQINPNKGNAEEAALVEAAKKPEEELEAGAEKKLETEDVFDESTIEEPLSEEEKAEKQQAESEQKAVERGLATLEVLFPKAGWENIREFPDLYPYFASAFKFKKGYELIAPTDPLLQVVILMRILEEIFFGLRYAHFGTIRGANGSERIAEPLGKIINDWQKNFQDGFEKEYLQRLDEYCRLLENTAESRNSNYAKRLLNELNWAKRLYFLPYYRFDSIMPPPFKKNEIAAIYSEVRQLRRYLTAVAEGIDQGNKQGGAESGAPCDGIDDPWGHYNFEVPNPVSIRLNALLSPPKRNNASLVFFALAVTVILDYLLNDESSWTNTQKAGFLFRSEHDAGLRPMFGFTAKVDADEIFKQVLKKRQAGG